MRIAYCITRGDTLGGAQIHVRDLALHFLRAGHEVKVFIGTDGPLADQLRQQGIPLEIFKYLDRPINIWRDALSIKELRVAFKSFQPDIISLHSAKAGIVGRLASFRIKSRVIFTAHGWSFTDGMPRLSAFIYKNLERATLPLADHIITVSEYDRNLALKHSVCAPEKLTTIHNGMPDVPCVRGQRDTSLVTITKIARFDQQKDHDTLFKALAGIKNRDWRLLLIGDGPKIEEAQETAAHLGLQERVYFYGLLPDVSNILADTDIYCLISNWEGFPRSILEAMRAKVPVVASDVGGVSEAITNGENGYLIPWADIESLQQKLEDLIDHTIKRDGMGRNARQKFESEFCFEQMVKKTAKIYRHLFCVDEKSKYNKPTGLTE